MLSPKIIKEAEEAFKAHSGIDLWGGPPDPPPPDAILPVPVGELIKRHPRLDEELVSGLVRLSETCNIIANPKVGKTWLAIGLALSIATGGLWLGRFRCRRGRVLIIDNEVKACTSAHRLPTVAAAMGIPPEDYQDRIDVINLRGRLLDLDGIGHYIVKHIPKGKYDAIELDAWYRTLNTSENDNQGMAMAYNLVDQFAEMTGSAWFLIHHASKGSQSDKRVTDVGAGAGSQSRAADSHIILREHEEDGAVVMEAAVRSFAPVEPVPLRWNFPVWELADDIDPNQLKGKKTAGEEKQNARDKEGREDILNILEGGPHTRRQLRTKTGMGPDRVNKLVSQLMKSGEVQEIKIDDQDKIQLSPDPGLDF